MYKEAIGDALNAKKYSEILSAVREDLLKPHNPFEGTFGEKSEENSLTERGLDFFKSSFQGVKLRRRTPLAIEQP